MKIQVFYYSKYSLSTWIHLLQPTYNSSRPSHSLYHSLLEDNYDLKGCLSWENDSRKVTMNKGEGVWLKITKWMKTCYFPVNTSISNVVERILRMSIEYLLMSIGYPSGIHLLNTVISSGYSFYTSYGPIMDIDWTIMAKIGYNNMHIIDVNGP